MKINFKSREDATTSAVIAVSILVMIGGLFYILTVPKQAAAKERKAAYQRSVQARTNDADLKRSSDAFDAAKKDLVKQLWDLKSEQIAPVTLNKITVLANARSLKVQSFRPQRIVSVDGIDRVPFQFTVDGTYQNVTQFAQAIEQSGEKLTVDMIQLSASDGNTDHVTATIQVSAYHTTEGVLDV